MIDFNCPNCGHSIHAPDSAAGKKGACKKCGESVRVTEPFASEDGPILIAFVGFL